MLPLHFRRNCLCPALKSQIKILRCQGRISKQLLSAVLRRPYLALSVSLSGDHSSSSDYHLATTCQSLCQRTAKRMITDLNFGEGWKYYVMHYGSRNGAKFNKSNCCQRDYLSQRKNLSNFNNWYQYQHSKHTESNNESNLTSPQILLVCNPSESRQNQYNYNTTTLSVCFNSSNVYCLWIF